MNNKRDNIYVYIWEELNTIYIGRSVNPKSRHCQHKSREREKTYKFSSKYGVEHPPMIILETNLSVEEGVEREKYWIKYYKDNGKYFVLNKTQGGEIGKLSELDENTIKERKKEYYKKNREKLLEYSKKYNKEHREELRIKEKIRYYRNRKPYQPFSKEEKEARRKEHYQKNKEKILLRNKKYREEHREEIKAQKKKYREEHREEIKQKKKEYYKKTKKR